MKWIPHKEMYHMKYQDGKRTHFIQEFYDCANVRHFFPEIGKEENHYEVIINKKTKEEMEMADANWYVKVDLVVIGPDEGPVTANLEYAATTEKVAKEIQKDLGDYFNGKNIKKNK